MTAIETAFADTEVRPRPSALVAPGLHRVLDEGRARSAAVSVSVAAASAAAVSASTLAERLAVASVACAVMVVAVRSCRIALRFDVAWRTERLLRALAGGLGLVAAIRLCAVALDLGLTAAQMAAMVVGAALAVVAATPSNDSDDSIDLRDGARDLRAVDPGLPPLCRASKRAIDVVVGSVAIVLVLPLMAMLAVVISAGSPGGWLFRQTRVGQGGRQFTLLKLRTMSASNDDSQHRTYVASLIANNEPAQSGLFKLANDPRVTPAGRWIRKLSLDELPQLLNVLRGDMSLVGPRPPLPSETELYDDWARLRLQCKPGMTGLWQVNGRSRVSFDDMVELDITYWRDWSLRRELSILARTGRAVFAADTA